MGQAANLGSHDMLVRQMGQKRMGLTSGLDHWPLGTGSSAAGQTGKNAVGPPYNESGGAASKPVCALPV